MKGVKRDSSAYPVFKDERFWDEFELDMTATCRAQGVLEVLNPDFVPRTEKEREYYKLQKDYMYSIFVKNIKTRTGKKFVHQQRRTADAQTVWRNILEASL